MLHVLAHFRRHKKGRKQTAQVLCGSSLFLTDFPIKDQNLHADQRGNALSHFDTVQIATKIIGGGERRNLEPKLAGWVGRRQAAKKYGDNLGCIEPSAFGARTMANQKYEKMMRTRPIIIWFRNDFRLADHPALAEACRRRRHMVDPRL